MSVTPYYRDDLVTLYHGDCIEVMRALPDSSVDAVVTDPPYGLEFMGKEWDAFGAPRAASTIGRSGEGAQRGGAKIKEDGGMTGVRVAFGGKRPMTFRCDGCGKRDQFRNAHECEAGWTQEVIDPSAPAPLAAFGDWCEIWATEAIRVLKPGGHLLAFGGTRTWHRLACAIEDAGFEVRDSIAWMYGSGFPKSLDVSKAIDKAAGATREVVGTAVYGDGHTQNSAESIGYGGSDPAADTRTITAPATPEAARWQGWGTALKPAFEPIVVARKPLIGTVAQNVLAHGTGALNVDGCRVGFASDADEQSARALGELRAKGRRLGVLGEPGQGDSLAASVTGDSRTGTEPVVTNPAGRWPANVILDESQARALDAMSGDNVGNNGQSVLPGGRNKFGDVYGREYITDEMPGRPRDKGGASRFFYTAKADSSERPRVDGVAHPTVKPLDLMRYLVRLVTPPGGVVLEPFAGSGTTLEACIVEGFSCIGIEREADYIPLIMQRITKPIEVTLL